MDLSSSRSREPLIYRVVRAVVFIGSAALAALALRFAWHQPLAAGVLVAIGAAYHFIRRRRLRRYREVLRSGDVQDVLENILPRIENAPFPGTMGPLLAATAFAARGWVDKARAALAAAQRSPAWDAAIEQRIFLDVLLLVFEGDTDAALTQAQRLARLPMHGRDQSMRRRVRTLRLGTAALARAFAHQSRPGDMDLLLRAGERSPIVFWAMRYGAAVIAVDQGNMSKVEELLAGAPTWPEESIFRSFHLELTERARHRAAA